MVKRKGSIQKNDLYYLITNIKERGLYDTLVEFSDWDDFEGTDLGDAIDRFREAAAMVKESIEDSCSEKGVEFSFTLQLPNPDDE